MKESALLERGASELNKYSKVLGKARNVMHDQVD